MVLWGGGEGSQAKMWVLRILAVRDERDGILH